MKNLRSNLFPEMNPFLELLGHVLKNLPDNPKPSCHGFCLAHYDNQKGTIVAEKLGEMPEKKEFKYFYFATKKVTQTLYFQASLSREFENKELEQFPGGVSLFGDCTGISGHDSMIDEAISALWLIVMHHLFKAQIKASKPMEKEIFWIEVSDTARYVQTNVMFENPWLMVICSKIKERFDFENTEI